MTGKTDHSPSGKRHHGQPDEIDKYAAVVFKGAASTPTKIWEDTPVAVLTAAVEYLKAGYQVRLSDGTVAWFAALPVPDVVFSDAATANGQAAALTGPPRIKPKKVKK
jgi:hypothetical protein